MQCYLNIIHVHTRILRNISSIPDFAECSRREHRGEYTGQWSYTSKSENYIVQYYSKESCAEMVWGVAGISAAVVYPVLPSARHHQR